MITDQILQEQEMCLAAVRARTPIQKIAEDLNLTRHQVRRRISAAKKRDRLDPEIASRLSARGLNDLSGLHSGWLLEKDENGGGQSLYFYLGPDQEKISFVDALMDVFDDIPRLDPIEQVLHRRTNSGAAQSNWIALADLHIGGDYGDPKLEQAFTYAIDDLIVRMPPAKHAVLFELGDLLEVNDHKGETPASGNRLEVKLGSDEFLKMVQTGIRLLRYAICRLAETHESVEVQFNKGNHDPTALIAVILALAEHFANNPRIYINVSVEEFRVISWGRCAAFPHHGDTLKWSELKDVFADQFPDEWAAAKAHRHILTAHFHHDRRRELIGATAEHFQTLHGPNAWAKARGMYARGSLSAMTVHEEYGERFRTISPIHVFNPQKEVA